MPTELLPKKKPEGISPEVWRALQYAAGSEYFQKNPDIFLNNLRAILLATFYDLQILTQDKLIENVDLPDETWDNLSQASIKEILSLVEAIEIGEIEDNEIQVVVAQPALAMVGAGGGNGGPKMSSGQARQEGNGGGNGLPDRRFGGLHKTQGGSPDRKQGITPVAQPLTPGVAVPPAETTFNDNITTGAPRTEPIVQPKGSKKLRNRIVGALVGVLTLAGIGVGAKVVDNSRNNDGREPEDRDPSGDSIPGAIDSNPLSTPTGVPTEAATATATDIPATATPEFTPTPDNMVTVDLPGGGEFTFDKTVLDNLPENPEEILFNWTVNGEKINVEYVDAVIVRIGSRDSHTDAYGTIETMDVVYPVNGEWKYATVYGYPAGNIVVSVITTDGDVIVNERVAFEDSSGNPSITADHWIFPKDSMSLDVGDNVRIGVIPQGSSFQEYIDILEEGLGHDVLGIGQIIGIKLPE